jgi:hypothetical protein
MRRNTELLVIQLVTAGLVTAGSPLGGPRTIAGVRVTN